MTRKIQCIREQLTQADAKRLVAGAGQTARVERAVYYPYLSFRTRYCLDTLFGRPRFESACLVDGRQGLVSTTDDFVTVELEPPPRDILDTRVEAVAAAAAVRRTMTHELGKKHRVLARLWLEIEPARPVYKKFWVVRCQGLRVLVDSATGCFIMLDGEIDRAA